MFRTMLRTAAVLGLALTAPNALISADSPPVAPNWTWIPQGAGGGGSFYVPSFNPKNPSEMWVTSDMAPVLHTTNLSAPDRKWACVHWSQYTGGRTSYVRFTSDAKILYGLTGKGDPIKTSDGGATWAPLSGWKTDRAFNILADPDSSTRILVSGKNDIFLSTDGGASLTSVYSAPDIYAVGVFFDPADKTIYLGTNKGLLKSTNNARFEIADPATPQNQPMVAFAGAKSSDGTIRLMCVTGSDITPGQTIEEKITGYKGIYTLDVGQKQWTARTDGIAATAKIGFVAMADGNINTIYVAGQDRMSPTIYKVTDASASWRWEPTFKNAQLGFRPNENIFTGWEGDNGDRSFGFDEKTLGFTVCPGNVNYAAFGGDGFLHYTSDGGATWHQAYVRPGDENPPDQPTPLSKAYHNVGLMNTGCHWITWLDRDTIVAGYTDINAARSTNSGRTWSIPDRTHLLNTQYVMLAAPNRNCYAASSVVHDMYQTWIRDEDLGEGEGNLIVSTDKGASWEIVHKFGKHPLVWLTLDEKDPSGNTMYASVASATEGGGIYKTTNLSAGDKSTWELLPAPPRTAAHPYNIRLLKDGSIVATYGDQCVNRKYTDTSGVFYSPDGGKTWSDRSDPKMHYYTRGITIDPTDPAENTWYVTTRNGGFPSGERAGGLFKTTDRGQSWKMVCDCSFEGAESCTINPATKEIFLATESHGLLWAPDTTAKDLTFVPTNYPFSHPIRVFINPYDPTDIWVASYGYGISQGRLAK